MEFFDYRGILEIRFKRNFNLSQHYEGTSYDLVAENSAEETESFGRQMIFKKVILVSNVTEPEAVEKELEKIPGILLSGFKSINKSRSFILIRVFCMKNIPFDLIQKVRNYSFSRSESGSFDSHAYAALLLVDMDSLMIYTNTPGAEYSSLFRIITPVETKEMEEE